MGFGLKDKTSLAYQKDESKSFRHKENALVLGLVGTTVLSGILLTLPRVLADDGAVTDVAITVPVACAITSTPDSAHTASVDSGTYKDNIGKTTIKTTCNDSQGFSIYAIGYTNDEYGNTVLKPITLDSPQNDIATGTATSGNTSNWAMKLTAVAGTTKPTITTGFDDYHVVPDTFTKVATFDSVTAPTVGASIETTYAVYVSGSQPADTYTGKVKYTMVHPASEEPLQPKSTASGQICYYANASGYEGSMGCQSVSSSVTLLASNFSRSGYGFAGWSDKFDYATNANAKFYGPNETITLTPSDYQSPNKGLSLYAVWVKSEGSLQDSNKVASVCSELDTAPTDGAANLTSVSALTDQRDNNTYAIAKLADGKCWMIENLRLESTAEHNTDGTLAQGYHSSFIGLSGSESANFSNSTTANDLYTTENDIEGKITISGSYQGYRFPRYNNTNTSTRASNPTGNGVAMYSYGNYYTWHAAIADTTHNGSNNTSSDTTSICPKGWRLPHGGQTTVNTTAEFYLLGKAIMNNIEPDQNASNGYGYYGNSVTNTAGKTATAAFRSYPNNFLYSGRFYGSSAGNRGSYGYYWSSTASNSNYSYRLYLGSSNVNPGTDYGYKRSGLSIRCVSGS